MADADLALGACGGAAWERCILGLPALVAVTAENQRDDSRILHSLGAVRNLGDAAETTAEMWAAEIAAMLEDPPPWRHVARSPGGHAGSGGGAARFRARARTLRRRAEAVGRTGLSDARRHDSIELTMKYGI